MTERHAPQLAPQPAQPHTSHAKSLGAGIALGVASYTWWGMGPLYFKALTNAGSPAVLSLCHRIAWSFLVLALLIAATRGWASVARVLRNRRTTLALLASTICIGINWLGFIYAVETDRVLESSLGYFINPLFTVLLGMAFLGERLRRAQWLSVALASCGVAWLTIARGGLPWIAIVLPVSFGVYSLIRKQTDVGPVIGLFVETALLAPLALAWIAWAHTRPEAGPAGINTPSTLSLLSFAGVMTAVPLVFFAAAAQRLPLSTLGFLQYINPTIQLITATLLFNETLDADRLIAFVLIWIGLAIFIADLATRTAASRATASSPPRRRSLP